MIKTAIKARFKGGKMFKKLLCNHTYKYYNTRVEYATFSSYGYYVSQFICPNCQKEIEISEFDIKDEYSKLKSKYNKDLVLGGDSIKISSFSHPRHMSCGIRYESPVATLMIEKYLKQGIDLRQLNNL